MNTKLLSDFLDNRQIAILTWIIVLFVFAVFRRDIRQSLVQALKGLTQRVIIISMFLMFLYIGLVVYFLYRIDFWNIYYISDTITWVIGSAFVMYININHVHKDNYLRNAVLDNLKIVAIISLFINVHIFSLWIELILIPFIVLISGLLAVSSTDPKDAPLKSCLTGIMTVFGLILLFFSLSSIFLNFSEFSAITNLQKLLLPLVLTILFLPFIYLLAIQVTYDTIFIRTKFFVKDTVLARYAKRKVITSFHLNLSLLKKWEKHIFAFKTKDDIDQLIRNIRSA